jgi:hypothetical protein
MRACAPLKIGRGSNVSPLLRGEELTVLHQFGTDVYELWFQVARRKFVHFAKASSVSSAFSVGWSQVFESLSLGCPTSSLGPTYFIN